MFQLAKVIHKEVFDLGDTMDLMAEVIKRQDMLLHSQNKRMSRIEKALNIENDEQADGNEDEDHELNASRNDKLYLVSNDVQEIISRYSVNYSSNIKKSKHVKSSNRNELLLGKAT